MSKTTNQQSSAADFQAAKEDIQDALGKATAKCGRVSVQGNRIDVEGVVTRWTAMEVLDAIKNHKGERLDIDINSVGGDADAGIAIYGRLRDFKRDTGKKVRTTVYGNASSSASLIFAAGDERLMSKGSTLMIHNAWALILMGDHNKLEKYASILRIANEGMSEIYADAFGGKSSDWLAAMDDETWYSVKSALNGGLATGKAESASKKEPYEASDEDSESDDESLFASRVEACSAYAAKTLEAIRAEATDDEADEKGGDDEGDDEVPAPDDEGEPTDDELEEIEGEEKEDDEEEVVEFQPDFDPDDEVEVEESMISEADEIYHQHQE